MTETRTRIHRWFLPEEAIHFPILGRLPEIRRWRFDPLIIKAVLLLGRPALLKSEKLLLTALAVLDCRFAVQRQLTALLRVSAPPELPRLLMPQRNGLGTVLDKMTEVTLITVPPELCQTRVALPSKSAPVRLFLLAILVFALAEQLALSLEEQPGHVPTVAALFLAMHPFFRKWMENAATGMAVRIPAGHTVKKEQELILRRGHMNQLGNARDLATEQLHPARGEVPNPAAG